MSTSKRDYRKNKFGKYSTKITVLAVFFALLFILNVGQVAAEGDAPYLQYHEPKQPAASLVSSESYFSLLASFLLVLGLAYLTSRLVANKMKWTAGNKDSKIISMLAFGSGRGVYLIEIADRYLIIGVTEHNINLLQEISGEEEVEKIKAMSLGSPQGLPNEQFDLVFRRQISSLQQMSKKFPNIFNSSDNAAELSQKKGNKNQNSLTREKDN